MTSPWKGGPVLVTGATGLVGSWLVKELLARGAPVVAFVLDADPHSELIHSGDIDKVSVVNGNLTRIKDIERAVSVQEVQTVFHLGAQTLVGPAQAAPLETFESNIRGTYNVLEVCRLHAKQIKRVVIASSDKAYGEAPKLPYTEDMPMNGVFPYEVSKSCADLLARSYFRTYGVPVAVARCGNTYGGGDLNWNRIIPGTIRSLLKGERPVLRSDGSMVRDYIYVKDIAGAYLDLAAQISKPGIAGQAFNFSAEKSMTVLNIVKAVQRVMEREDLKPKIEDTASGEIQDQKLSSAKARRLLHWKPAYTLDQALEETVDWYRAWLA